MVLRPPRTDDFREQEAMWRKMGANISLANSSSDSVAINASVVTSKTLSVASVVSNADSKINSEASEASLANSKADSAATQASTASVAASQASSQASGASTAAGNASGQAAAASTSASTAKSVADSGAFATCFINGIVTTVKISTSQVDYTKRQVLYSGSISVGSLTSGSYYNYVDITHNLGRNMNVTAAADPSSVTNVNYGTQASAYNINGNTFRVTVCKNVTGGTVYYYYW